MNHEKIVNKSYTQNFLHIDYRDYIQVSYVYTILLVLGLLHNAHIIAFRVYRDLTYCKSEVGCVMYSYGDIAACLRYKLIVCRLRAKPL